MDRMLLLGDAGKLGRAVGEVCSGSYVVEGRGRASGLDAEDLASVDRLLRELRPDAVVNAIAMNGLEACERDPDRAFRVNALFPQRLARLSRELGFTLIHFSTDAVFSDAGGGGPRIESDPPCPMNVYGLTKLGGDCLVQAEAERYHIHRLSVLFGPPGRTDQFLERMLARVRQGERQLRLAADVTCSPSYTLDVAERVLATLRERRPPGLYHTANAGRASLFQLMEEVKLYLGLEVDLEPVPCGVFGGSIPRSLGVSLASAIQEPLRDWREALRSFCASLPGEGRGPA